MCVPKNNESSKGAFLKHQHCFSVSDAQGESRRVGACSQSDTARVNANAAPPSDTTPLNSAKYPSSQSSLIPRWLWCTGLCAQHVVVHQRPIQLEAIWYTTNILATVRNDGLGQLQAIRHIVWHDDDRLLARFWRWPARQQRQQLEAIRLLEPCRPGAR